MHLYLFLHLHLHVYLNLCLYFVCAFVCSFAFAFVLHFTPFLFVACDCIVGSSASSLLLARLLCLFLVRNSGYKPYLISLPSPPPTLLLFLFQLFLLVFFVLQKQLRLTASATATLTSQLQRLSDSNSGVGCCEEICFLMWGDLRRNCGEKFNCVWWGELRNCGENLHLHLHLPGFPFSLFIVYVFVSLFNRCHSCSLLPFTSVRPKWL